MVNIAQRLRSGRTNCSVLSIWSDVCCSWRMNAQQSVTGVARVRVLRRLLTGFGFGGVAQARRGRHFRLGGLEDGVPLEGCQRGPCWALVAVFGVGVGHAAPVPPADLFPDGPPGL